MSPFAQRAKEMVPEYKLKGGKSDDITVVIGKIILAGNPLNKSEL